jgi:X-Pro dipeptidyl-peptidase C-terminal non-catalytic domain
MATQLFLRDDVGDTQLATDNLRLNGAAEGWTTKSLATGRGGGTVSVSGSTVTGPTSGIEVASAGRVLQFISPPVAADVTISGTITLNIWAAENNMSANVAINVVIDVIRANATGTRNSNTIVEIARTARVTEVAVTTPAVNNFTVTPTSTVVNRGDRIRVRVFGDDAGTMATGFTFTVTYDSPTAAVSGDTYVTFNETFSFLIPAVQLTTGGSDTFVVGTGGGNEETAQSFVAHASADLTRIAVMLSKSGTPGDNLVVTLCADSAGSPGSTIATLATIAGSSLTTTDTMIYSDVGSPPALTEGTTYWIKLARSGARDTSNFYVVTTALQTFTYAQGVRKDLNSGAWSAASNDFVFEVFTGTPLYLTDTASAVATASVDREAWTARGAGVANDVTNTAAGWLAPVQVTDTAGGTVVDWFTKQLQAFTLAGLATVMLRGLESNLNANASLRCEIARVDSDGTNPTVWATWCAAGELGTSEAAQRVLASGDDLAVSDGQRLRIRVYTDDTGTDAQATAFTVTTHYNGTTDEATGDAYVVIPATLTEFSAVTVPRGPAVTFQDPAVV